MSTDPEQRLPLPAGDAKIEDYTESLSQADHRDVSEGASESHADKDQDENRPAKKEPPRHYLTSREPSSASMSRMQSHQSMRMPRDKAGRDHGHRSTVSPLSPIQPNGPRKGGRKRSVASTESPSGGKHHHRPKSKNRQSQVVRKSHAKQPQPLAFTDKTGSQKSHMSASSSAGNHHHRGFFGGFSWSNIFESPAKLKSNAV